jgi:hypothetical protein
MKALVKYSLLLALFLYAPALVPGPSARGDYPYGYYPRYSYTGVRYPYSHDVYYPKHYYYKRYAYYDCYGYKKYKYRRVYHRNYNRPPDYFYSTEDSNRERLLVDALAGRLVTVLAASRTGLPAGASAAYARGFAAGGGFGGGFGGGALPGGGFGGPTPGAQMISPEVLAALMAQMGYPPPGGGAPPGGVPPAEGRRAPAPPAEGEEPPAEREPRRGAAGGKAVWYAEDGGAVPEKLREVVKTSCLKCHSGTNPARMNLSDLRKVSLLGRGLASGLVRSGKMPKGGKPLADTDSALFEQWFDAAYGK